MTISYILFSSLHIFVLIFALFNVDDDIFSFLGPLSYASLFLNSLINPILFLTVSTPAKQALKKTLCRNVVEN